MAGGDYKYTTERAEHICQRLAAGVGLDRICREARVSDPDFPTSPTIRLWNREDLHGFASVYARARNDGMDHLAEEIVEIADTEPDSNAARVRIDARKWLAAKLAPKRYGERATIEHANERPEDMTDTAVMAAAAEAVARLGPDLLAQLGLAKR